MRIYEIRERIPPGYSGNIDDSLLLDHEQRARGRFKALASSGAEVRVFLERGTPLAIGTVLHSRCDCYIEVKGAVEELTIAQASNWSDFSRACYHLGNRHVPLQLGEQWLCFKPDHVLEEMLERLGLRIEHDTRVFAPEQGAYAGHAH